MELKKAVQLLEHHNKWRRGDELNPMTNPTQLGIAIDVIVDYFKSLEETDLQPVIERFFKETGKNLTVEASTDDVHYSVYYVEWLENELLKKTK